METANKVFDPLGFSALASDETMRWYRAAELKHGRVAMLAATGYMVQKLGMGIIPLTLDKGTNIDLNNVEHHATGVKAALAETPTFGLFQIISVIGMIELFSETQKPHYTKGTMPGFNPLGFKITEGKQLKELKNGRLAMIGIASFWSAENIPGSVPIHF